MSIIRTSVHVRAVLFACAFILATYAVSPEARAERTGSLNEDNVREFVLETTDITSGKDKRDPEYVRDYLERHLHKKGFFKSEIRYTIPGFPTQKNTLSLDKSQFIESAVSGQDTLDEYEAEIEISDVKISKDGKKATLTTSSMERGLMPFPREDGGNEQVPVEGSSECGQIIMLEKGVIQMYAATCKTEIIFMAPF